MRPGLRLRGRGLRLRWPDVTTRLTTKPQWSRRLSDPLAYSSARADAHVVNSGVCIRTAGPADATALAQLKELWADLPSPATDAERIEFASSLARWMQERGDSVICRVAEFEGALIGMAWLIVFERVPDIRDRHRRTGDIQSVFVQPSHRGRGIGSQLIRALTVIADDLGIPRVTVSANSRAVPVYQALGFVETPFLLERRPRAVSSR